MCKGNYSCHNNSFRRHASKNIVENIEIKHHLVRTSYQLSENTIWKGQSPKIRFLEPFGVT